MSALKGGLNFFLFFSKPNTFHYARWQRDRRVEWILNGLALPLSWSVLYTATPFVRVDHCCCFSKFFRRGNQGSVLVMSYLALFNFVLEALILFKKYVEEIQLPGSGIRLF
jgi:hypothetical protein